MVSSITITGCCYCVTTSSQVLLTQKVVELEAENQLLLKRLKFFEPIPIGKANINENILIVLIDGSVHEAKYDKDWKFWKSVRDRHIIFDKNIWSFLPTKLYPMKGVNQNVT